MRSLLLFLSFLFSALSLPIRGVEDPNDLPPLAKEILANMDLTADPCNDFYQYSCGGWIKNNPVPASASLIYRSFTSIQNYNEQILLQIVNNPSPQQDPRLQTLYRTCMNVSAADALGRTPLGPILDYLNSLQSKGDIARAVGNLHTIGAPAFFQFGSGIDSGDPTINIAQLDQAGLFLPQQVYTDAETQSRYLQHITNIFKLAGLSGDDATAQAKQALFVETLVANITIPQDERVDPFQTYNKMTLAQLKSLVPSFNWDYYLLSIGSSSLSTVNVVVPLFFSRFDGLFSSPDVDVPALISYLKWQYIHTYAPVLSSDFVNETFAFFGTYLSGQQEQTPRDEFCLALLDQNLGELLGSYYVQLAFSEQAKQNAENMVQQIEGAMKRNLQTLDWMDNTTRARALEKLSQIYNMIGFPEKPNQYAGLNVQPNALYDDLIAAQRWAFVYQINQNGKPSDRTQWEMTADTVNAYYEPTKNEMVFPAGILQTPFFNSTYPDPLNFGGAGFVMGHELTHGFDNQGKDYDGTGKLIDWWQPSTEKIFDSKAACIVKQYSSFEVLPGVFIDGNKTQGENIADNGGIKNAFNAYVNYAGPKANQTSIIPQYSNLQLFFIAVGQSWCENITPQALKRQVQVDVHSPAKYRVLGPLMNFPSFSESWSCPLGSRMNPVNKCAVW